VAHPRDRGGELVWDAYRPPEPGEAEDPLEAATRLGRLRGLPEWAARREALRRRDAAQEARRLARHAPFPNGQSAG
jgi:hypothetical protein